MSGNISTEEKCSVCKGKMLHDERRQGCYCLVHTKVAATRLFRVRFGRKINKRYHRYDLAYQFLMGLRYEKASGKLDVRDHMYSNPLGFANLGREYIKFKEKQDLAEMGNIKRYIRNATAFFGETNVKDIKKKDITSFLDSLKKTIRDEDEEKIQVSMASKTKACYCSQLHDFYHNFLYEEEEILEITQLPKFPKVKVRMGYRKLITIEDRERVMDCLKTSTKMNPKIWLGVDLLASYGRIRPIDLRRLREGDINLEYGFMTFWRPSKSQGNSDPKVVSIKLLDFHVEEFKKIKRKFPATEKVLFFRHVQGWKGAVQDAPFSPNVLWANWKRACKKIGFDDVDLYGGTRHSSTSAIGMALGKKKAKGFSGHNTNKAFDRYCQLGEQDDFEASQLMAKMRGKVVDFEQAKKSKT